MISYRSLTAGLAALIVAGLNLSADAIKSGSEIKEKTVTSQESPGFIAIGHLPINTEQLVILAESAKVKVVRSASAHDITVTSNCPHNWNVLGGVVRQAGFATPKQGVSMMADALGSRAIVNGKIYVLPSGAMKGISMNKEGVSIGGQKIEPLAGVDMPGTCEGPDALEISVPTAYAGDLVLGAGSDSDVTVDSWQSGKVVVTMLGKSSISIGKLKSLAKAVLDIRGQGKAEIGDLSTKVLVANIAGSGSVIIKGGSADISNATVAGDGKISLKGNYKNLKKVVEGQGSIQLLD